MSEDQTALSNSNHLGSASAGLLSCQGFTRSGSSASCTNCSPSTSKGATSESYIHGIMDRANTPTTDTGVQECHSYH